MLHMRDLFANDPSRVIRFSAEFDNIRLDYSKNRINDDTMRLLFDLAREVRVDDWINKMFSGEQINTTEKRPVLHVALRDRSNNPIFVDGEDIKPLVLHELQKIKRISEAIRAGNWKGTTGKSITDVVHVGVGGSCMGPYMVTEALKHIENTSIKLHFLSNIDGNHVARTLAPLNPETTLFIVASKTFKTEETLANAEYAKKWLVNYIGPKTVVARHFTAVCRSPSDAEKFGVARENILATWDWVCGRFSVWGGLGLSIAISLGYDKFEELLAGAHRVDEHLRATTFEKNISVILAVLGIWHNNFFGSESYAVLPYGQSFHLLPVYLQQLEMESNGKCVDRNGNAVDYATGPIVWGECGTDCQHTFLQLVHQGTRLIPSDFIVSLENPNPLVDHHDRLLANCYAQSEALMKGKTLCEVIVELEKNGLAKSAIENLAPHMVYEGNRSSNTISIKKLTPETFGALIAIYEHKVFVQGVIWNINSFDQWGVELGKALARNILTKVRH